MLPLAPHQVSLRLYPHPGSAEEIMAGVLRQARLAEAAGLDGVMISEHHGGFPGYLPDPVQFTGFVLGVTERIWAAPCPLLLPLRHWSQTAEQLAWLATRFPGRVGAGFAIGGLDRDFEMADLDYADRRVRFAHALPRIVAALRGQAEGALAEDAAIAACGGRPLPMVVAAQGPLGVDRAAGLDSGVLFDSMQTVERMGELSARHRAAAPTAVRIAIRRVWIGPPPEGEAARQMEFYRGYAPKAAQRHWGEGQELVQGATASEVVDALLRVAEAGGADAFNLRVHLVGVAEERVEEQIERLGREVAPALREGLAARSRKAEPVP
jgi:alkanesulfonate monooxygenase SsuD/methylene tetrahydromethanopterin reductase-like flavin-dependent oxidoreductase (luciferase family)